MTRRDVGVDAARGVAVLSMFTAHAAGSAGPFKLVTLTDFLTAPSFVLLIGMGAELGRGRSGWRAVLVRAITLVVLGYALAEVPSQILIVLVPLGVVTVLCALLVRLPTVAVAVVGALLLVAEPPLISLVSHGAGTTPADSPGAAATSLSGIVFTSYAYRLTAFVPFACLGILLVRLVGSDRLRLRVGGAGLAGAVLMYGAHLAGAFDLIAYLGSYQELVFECFLATALACLVPWAVHRVDVLGRALAPLGAMSLTLYVVQVLLLAGYLQTSLASGTDNSWPLLACLVVLAFVLAHGWQRALRGTRFARGPLEGAVGLLA